MLLLVLTTLMWSGNAVASKLAVGHVSPMVIVFLRWMIVAGLMSLIAWRELVASWDAIRPHLVSIALMAAFGFSGFNGLFYLAAHNTTAVNIGILQGSIPMIVVVGAYFLFGVRVTLVQFLGILLTLLGVFLVASQGSWQVLLNLQINPGDALMLVAALFYAGYTLALRNRPKVPALAFFAVMAFVAALVSLPMLAVEYSQETLVWPTVQGWLVIFYIALCPSFLAQIFFMRGVEMIGPNRAGVFVNLVPVFSAAMAIILLGEEFALYHGAALALVLGGIWIAEKFAWEKRLKKVEA
ncbi:membrane protein [Pseudovibrio japonicus]|uniref:Membrane protein n=1 Tax=Pseudovibrio japonicus TaxID=366534 RepID=A0ABQ3E3I5_9HYPH|nr:DMT family transporter [Pseudovibrio japonicus]GHB19984.1 membrane protein [Pseudovibrio japonicus]